jgi:PAS domain S-box-containing protein
MLVVGSGGQLVMALSALALAPAIFVLAIASDRFGDSPLFLLAVPMTLAAFSYGLWGGVVSTVIGSGIATAWWVEKGYPGGAAWYCSRIGTYLALGAILGAMVDSRRGLLRQLERHAELSLDLIATANFDGYFTRVNPAFTRTLGWTPKELTSRPFLDFVHRDDRQATIAEAARQTEAGEEVIRFQNRYRHKDGGYRWLEWMSRPEPSTSTLIAVARDVTERKELERREHEYQQQLEQAVRERTLELQQRNTELEEAKRETLRRLALAAEYRDDETFEHTERVGRAAALLARALGLSDHDVALIRDAAPLHDVGKLSVSDTLLLKPGKLTSAEFDLVKRHADAGAAILAGSSSEILRTAEEIASSHHEWWDGSGYPRGLAGNEIPLIGRIVAVVDVFDALTHTRPYKEAWPIPKAVDEIRRLAGRQFDPKIVTAFDRLDHHTLAGAPTHPQITGIRAVA